MVAIISSGQFDIIGAARPSISDPFLPKKIEEGHPEDIRECIGCNQCISRWEIGGPPMICTQNATAGEEYRRGWHPEKFHPAANRDKGVLVVGAGPAGMECAMVLGKRDMSAVHVVEADKEIGGCVNWISQLGHSDGKENLARGTARGLGEWKRIVNYRQIQLDKLKNVDVHLNSRLSTQDVLEYGAEIVIIATGCHFATNGLNPATHDVIEGADTSLDWQLTPDEVVRGDKQIGDRVLVLENEGYYMGVSIAQKLAGEGKDVTLVTQMGDVANYMEFTLEAPMLHRDLHRLGVKIHTVHDAREDRAGRLPRVQRVEPGAQGAVRGRHRRALHAAPVERRALPRAARGQGGARARGHRGGLHDRRRVRPAHDPGLRSSTATGSPARSTARTRRCRCRSSASGGCGATSATRTTTAGC